MELEKAIELLTDLHKIPTTHLDPDYLDAIKLGTEALNFLRNLRPALSYFSDISLPTETPTVTHLKPTRLIDIGL